ncbi:MAG: AI-2E family transporter, partial [Bacillota bacterium]
MKIFGYTPTLLQKNTILILCIIVANLFFFKYIFPILFPFIIGFLLSFLFRPVVNFADKTKLPRGILTLLVILVFLSSIFFLVYLFVNKLTDQMLSLLENSPTYIEEVSRMTAELILSLDNLLLGFPPILSEIFQEIQTDFFSILLSFFNNVDPSFLVSWVPRFLLNFCIALFTSYFFTKEDDLTKKIYENYINPLLGNSLTFIKTKLLTSLLAYCKTQGILMIYVFLISVVALNLLQSPYAFLLSIGIAIVDALPFFGSGFFLWPMAFYYCFIGSFQQGFLYLALYLALQFLRQMLQPKILAS